MRPSWTALTISTLALIAATPFETLGAVKHLDQTKYILYIGAYGKGITAYRFDAATGQLQSIGMMGEVTNPSFLTADKDFRYLYAVSELEGNKDGAVAGFAIDRTSGALHALNSRSSAGVAPCHLAVDHTSKMVMVANYGTGGVSTFPIEADGRLGEMASLMTAKGSGPDAKRQDGPHAHEVVISNNNQLAYVPDLGLDHIRMYRLDPSAGTLSPNDPAFVQQTPGMGPRHIAFTPDERFAYVINELKSEVSVFSRDSANGNLTKIEDVPSVASGYAGKNGPAEILVDNAGKFVYATNRGEDTIAVFSIDPSDGKLKMVQSIASEGKNPRGLEIDPTGHFIFAGNQDTNNFVIYHLDKNTGKLSPTGEVIHTPSPVAFLFVPVK
jgi:6-phosphogluconolactonase